MTGLRSICNQWRNESQCQNLVPLTSAASSKRVNGLLSSTLACFDSDPFKDNDFVASGTAHFADRRRDVGMESDQISSRNKRSKVDTSKRVNFAETVNIIGCLPYKKGLTDAETIKLYHTDIWYTHKDYASFLKDRLDTIRVYHSVNGDMSCLKDYYSARGLEQHLHFQQNLCLQQKQRRLIAAVLSEQMRQKQGGCKDPEALQQQAALQTAEALEAAQQRAAMDAVDVMATTQTDEESVCDNHSSVSGDDDEPLSPAVRSHPGREEALVRPSEVNVPMPDLSLTAGKLNGVDIVSLRTMNMHLLNKMRAKVAAKSKKINSCNNNELSSSTLEELDKELEQWETLYRMQLHRRDSLSQQSSSSKPSTSVSLDYIASTFTNHALAVSNIRRDSLSTAAKSFSMNPSLISLQQQGFPLHTTAQQIQREARLTYRNEATTSISKVRRDSLAGAHSLIMEDL